MAKKDDKPEDGEELDAPPKPKTPLLVLILLVLNLGVTGFVAFTVLTAPTPEAQAAEMQAAAKKKSEEPGPIQPMEPFVVNLNDPEKPRFLKLTVNLELTHKDVVKEFEGKKLAVRDGVMTYLAGLTIKDVLGEEAKLTLKKEIEKRLISAWGEHKVRTVYLTEIVVQ